MEKKTKIILGVGALVVGILIVSKYLKSDGKSTMDDIIDDIDDDIDDDNGGGSTGGGFTDEPTGLDYNALANTLYGYMNGYGTNYKKIFEILGMLSNQSDWNKLQNAYGTRTLSSGFGNIFVDDYTGSLKGALYDELSSSEYKTAIKILKDKGITF